MPWGVVGRRLKYIEQPQRESRLQCSLLHGYAEIAMQKGRKELFSLPSGTGEENVGQIPTSKKATWMAGQHELRDLFQP